MLDSPSVPDTIVPDGLYTCEYWNVGVSPKKIARIYIAIVTCDAIGSTKFQVVNNDSVVLF